MSWFRTYLSRPAAELRLVCFPHAGGAASAYREWAALLPEQIELVAVQYPGRQDRYHEEPLTDFADLVEGVAAELPQLEGPTAYFGHSMGATVAFEAARRLSVVGRGPERLFASARIAPAVATRTGLSFDDEDEVMTYIRDLGGAGGQLLEIPELRQLALPMLRADFQLMESYVYHPGVRLDCPITVLAGSEDHTFGVGDAAEWGRHTTAGLTVEELPGGHFYTEQVPGQVTELITRTVISEGVHP
ncbi:thioesterase II family protein [Kribbella sp. CA-293567]|uniref:thioesterase II family protein n=1 Tax=Kribbella sp. CA-293567 TaxID=3002436 RepID=UPI0022DD77E5|nr:alpha/beta fold hydrolase [Kribbella sp. CA-293567]WBQ08269.1 alpha/beta fold hydrolase [Kribbella sp. CA-293567]